MISPGVGRSPARSDMRGLRTNTGCGGSTTVAGATFLMMLDVQLLWMQRLFAWRVVSATGAAKASPSKRIASWSVSSVGGRSYAGEGEGKPNLAPSAGVSAREGGGLPRMSAWSGVVPSTRMSVPRDPDFNVIWPSAASRCKAPLTAPGPHCRRAASPRQVQNSEPSLSTRISAKPPRWLCCSSWSKSCARTCSGTRGRRVLCGTGAELPLPTSGLRRAGAGAGCAGLASGGDRCGASRADGERRALHPGHEPKQLQRHGQSLGLCVGRLVSGGPKIHGPR